MNTRYVVCDPFHFFGVQTILCRISHSLTEEKPKEKRRKKTNGDKEKNKSIIFKLY